MSKIKRVIKTILITLLILMLSLVLFVAWWIWYNFYDVTGLTLYENEPIVDIIPHKYNVYFITQDGGYVMGDFYLDSSRVYKNSSMHRNEKLDIPSPVKFTNEKIAMLFPYDRGTLFITATNDLYDSQDEISKFICSDVIYADINRFNSGSIIYSVYSSGNLYAINENGEQNFLHSGIKAVKAYRDRIFVLSSNGDLCELVKAEHAGYELSEPLFEKVVDFEVLDTSTRYDGNKLVYNDEYAIKTPLFNVLTENGELYAKGAYNMLSCTLGFGEKPQPFELKEWTLISENVNSFDLAPMGTVYIKNDTSCEYYGFDTKIGAKEVDYKELIPQGAISAYTAENLLVIVKTTENKYYIWSGIFNEFTKSREGYNIFTGSPYVIEP